MSLPKDYGNNIIKYGIPPIMHDWDPDSWRRKSCAQSIAYPDKQAFDRVLQQLQQQPPLVSIKSIVRLQQAMEAVYAGNAFLWQGGNCAESFLHADADTRNRMCALLSRVGALLAEKQRIPVVCIGRIAGQYAKPRTQARENRAGIEHLSYYGDLINGSEFTEASRTPDPKRMLLACAHMAATHRALPDSIYTSHEALHLPYETVFTRITRGLWYNRSTHFPWVGVRTCHPEGAHIEYIRGIVNPIALKVGPDFSVHALQACMERLNPQRVPGRLTLIHRLGVHSIVDKLPDLIDAVRAADQPVIWCCDPMHGNTQRHLGRKRRYVEDIAEECRLAFAVHQSQHTRLAGLHLELTVQPSLQCASRQQAADTEESVPSTILLDPCLNPEQAITLVGTQVPQR